VRAIPPPLEPRREALQASADARDEPAPAPAPYAEPAIAKPIAAGWRRTSYRSRQEVTTVTRLLEDVLAPAPPPSDAPPVGRSSPPAGIRASSPPPVISDRPEAPTEGRFARPVSDLPAPIENPAPADAAKDLRDQLLAFLAEDAPSISRAKGSAVDAELQAFLGATPPPPSVEKGGLVPVPVASAAVVAKQAGLDPRAGFILMFMDGVTPLAEVIDACGLPHADATRIVDDLTARGLVELRDRSKRA
jgi:hypothetical protein